MLEYLRDVLGKRMSANPEVAEELTHGRSSPVDLDMELESPALSPVKISDHQP